MDDLARKRIENAVAAFIAKRRPPEHLRHEVDLDFRFDGRTVEIFTIRPRWNDPSETVESAIAKTRYIKLYDHWRVYWQRADLKWHSYQPMPEVTTIQAFLRLVDEDAYSCFFG